jgi:HK97 family phage major capsid protein
MDIKELEGIIAKASEAVNTKAANAEKVAGDALAKAAEFLSKINEKADKTETDELQKQFDTLSTKMNEMQKKGGNVIVEKSLSEEIGEKKEAIRDLMHKRNTQEIILKAPTLRASVADSEQSFHLPSIGQLGVKERNLYNVLPKINLGNGDHNGIVSYVDWDEDTTVRAAAARAENTEFPESTAKFKYYKEALKKVGDTLPVSEEFGEDQVMAAAELSRFIAVNVEQEVSRQLAVADGTGNQFRGLINRSTTYVPTGFSIVDANLKDLARKMRTAIVKGRGSKYRPDIIVMNSDTYDQYYLKKDGENRYLFDENGNIAGLTVVEDNFIPDNELIVGDRRFASIYMMGGIVLSEGQVDKQFVEDMKTLKARKRMMMLIREVDRTGFLHCTNIEVALATLETAPPT